MAIGQQSRTTAVSILQIGISHNTKCAIKDSFHRDSHIYVYICMYSSYILNGILYLMKMRSSTVTNPSQLNIHSPTYEITEKLARYMSL